MGGITLFISPYREIKAAQKVRTMQTLSPHLGEPQVLNTANIGISIQKRHHEADLFHDDAMVVAFNGYLSSLAKSEDETHTLNAQSVATLLREQGTGVLSHLTGEFVLVYINKHTQEAHLATSAVLTRPLFWVQTRDGCAMASECRQLWTQLPGEPLIRKEAIVDLMAFHGPTRDFEQTMFQGVYRLSPASLYRISPHQPKPEKIAGLWEPPDYGPLLNEHELIELAEQRIKNATQRSLNNTQSAFSLSGGLDSTLLWAIAQKTTDTHNPPYSAHSMLYPGMSCDETPRIEAVLQHTQTHAIGQDGRALSESLCLPFQLTAVDQVLTRATAYQIDVLSLSMRQNHANTHITGAGAELIFHCSPRFSHDLLRQGQIAKASRITWDFEDYGIDYGHGPKRWLKDTLLPPGSRLRHLIRPSKLPLYITKEWHTHWQQGHLDEHTNSLKYGYGRGERLTYWQRYTTASALESSMQLSEHYGLEFRSPYFDRSLLDLAFSTQPEQLVMGNRQKGLLRNVAARWLPDAISKQTQKTAHAPATEGDILLLSSHQSADAWQLVGNDLLNADHLNQLLSQALRNRRLPPKLEYLLLIERFSGRYNYG